MHETEAIDPYAGSVLSSRPLPLAFVRDPKWNRFLYKIVHWWRYGISHPDEDLIGVIEAVGDSIAVQAATARAVLTGAKAEEAAKIEAELRAQLTSPFPDFANLLSIEARLNALYPVALARRRRWAIEERFQRVAAPAAYQSWRQDQPVRMVEQADEALLEQAREGVRQAKLQESESIQAMAIASERVAAARQAVEAATTALTASDPGLDLPAERARLDVAAEDDSDAAAMRERLAPLLDAEKELAAAEQAEGEARKAREAAEARTKEAARRALAAEAEFAARHARANLEEKSRKAEVARRLAASLPQGTDERREADRRLEEAEAEREIARTVFDDKTGVAARLADETGGGGESGGAGGGDGSGGGTGGGSGSTGGTGGSGGTGAGEGSGEPVGEERADTLALLNYIHSSYLMTISREKAIRDLKRWLLMRFWLYLIILSALLAGVISALLATGMGKYWGLILGIVLVAAAGRAGATVSISRRLQAAVNSNLLESDPIVELTALRTGKSEISLALMTSSVFALLLYAFFLTGVPSMLGFQKGIFPEAKWTELGAPNAAAAGAPSGGEKEPMVEEAEVDGGGKEVVENAAEPAAEQDAEASINQTAAADQAEPAAEAAPPEANAVAAAPPAAAPAAPAAATLADVRRSSEEAGDAALTALAAAVAQQERLIATAEKARAAALRQDLPSARVEALNQELRFAQRRLADLKSRLGKQQARTGELSDELACKSSDDCMPFDDLAAALALGGGSDFFKLLIWAFVAGFAERFVPDVLDRIVARSQAVGASATGAVAAAQARAPASGLTTASYSLVTEQRSLAPPPTPPPRTGG
jgi:uncharacterized membrane protein YgcG